MTLVALMNHNLHHHQTYSSLIQKKIKLQGFNLGVMSNHHHLRYLGYLNLKLHRSKTSLKIRHKSLLIKHLILEVSTMNKKHQLKTKRASLGKDSNLNLRRKRSRVSSKRINHRTGISDLLRTRFHPNQTYQQILCLVDSRIGNFQAR